MSRPAICPETVQALVNEAQRRFQSNRDGTTSRVYPRLPVSPAGEPTAAASEASALGVLVGIVAAVIAADAGDDQGRRT
jgi:hypothetical protein